MGCRHQGSTGVVKNLRVCTHYTCINLGARTEEVLENLSVRRDCSCKTSVHTLEGSSAHEVPCGHLMCLV
jgi:hypothetical protein